MAILKFLLLALALLGAAAIIAFWLFSRTGRGAERQLPGRLFSLGEVIERERIYIRSRRLKAELPGDEDSPALGIALSGGGIRSATLCLGVLQALALSRLPPRIDYLSTVSGGGYLGSAFSSLLSCKRLTEHLGPDDPSQYAFGPSDRPHFSLGAPEDTPFFDDQRTPGEAHRLWLSARMVVLHLRAFGEYLVRRSRALDRDVLRALGTVLTGILSTLLLFAHVFLVGAANALLAIAVVGGEPVPALDGGVLGYLATLINGAGGRGD